MQTYTFIYSNNLRYRLLRHCMYWLGWIAYFIIIDSTRAGASEIGYARFLLYTTLEVLVSLSVDVLFCYSTLYILIPRLLYREKYFYFFAFTGLFLLLDAALSSYFYTWIINPLRVWFHLVPFTYIAFTDLLRGLNGVVMLTSVAVCIRLFKNWQLKKQELELEKSEKISHQFAFLHTFIQPAFLPDLLKKIHSFSYTATTPVPEMLDKLHRIVVYLMEECNQRLVSLSRELEIIRDYVLLEQLTNPRRYNIDFQQKGDPSVLEIVPYILFPFVESNVRQISRHITDKHWAHVRAEVDGTRISLEVSNSKPVETSNLLNFEAETLQQIRKRLELLYPGSYRINTIIEENSFTIQLEIDLSKLVQ